MDKSSVNGTASFKFLKVPENDLLGVYIVQRDNPFLEDQHPSPLKEDPTTINHTMRNWTSKRFET